MLRAHQAQLDDLAKAIVAGDPIARLYIGVIPGGGKSWLAPILAQRLLGRYADGLCWVVPRRALQTQGEKAFLGRELRRLIGHSHEIRVSTNGENPARTLSGYTSTYQAIAADARQAARTGTLPVNVREFTRRRYILILDEPHHCEEGGEWHRALQPLVDRAALVVFMSGTWERGDGRKIAWLPYEYVGNQKWRPALANLDPDEATTAYIHYTRTDALREQAIKPLHFESFDGPIELVDREGQQQYFPSLAGIDEVDAPDAVWTALRTDFAIQLLARCVGDWKAYRSHRSSGKLLIVAPTIALARAYLGRLKDMGVTDAGIATSDDSDAALREIERFKLQCGKPGCLDVLVTVAMAYEGLDVPQVTHIACLTHIRSRPWIEQMFARAVRVDAQGGPYHEQWGRIYCPDDPLLLDCITRIREEQEAVARERAPERVMPDAPAEPDAPVYGAIVPIAGEVARERAFDLATGQALDHDETQRLIDTIKESGMAGLLDALVLKRMVDAYNARGAGAQPAQDPPEVRLETPASVREQRLRTEIATYIARYEDRMGSAFGTLNGDILRRFKVPRDEMTEQQLQRVWACLQEFYPLPA